jgi:hypothetical protein
MEVVALLISVAIAYSMPQSGVTIVMLLLHVCTQVKQLASW